VASEIKLVRLDKWLWASRFFKTRKLATDAINNGKVFVNGQRIKPGKEIKEGVEIKIVKNGYTWDITVLEVTPNRRSAKEAALLYQEDPESFSKRQLQIQADLDHKLTMGFSGIDHKPNKKERRLIHQFKQSPE
jgi:ribosome-associated heat shock protein Hsp15